MRPARLRGRTFASLRNHRDYRLYFAGNAVSFVGTWMQQIAAYWLVLELTRSPVAVGALALVQTLPITVFALLGGAIADRVDLRRMVIGCESVLAAVATTLAVLALTGAIEAWHLYALGFAQGVAIALDAPARHTLVFRIVGRDDLPNAVALSSALGTSARIAGPALGGLVVAAAGPGVAFAVNAASYAFVICAIGTWISLDENIRQYVQEVFLMRVHPIPKWWISSFITFGFAMSALHFLRKLDPRATETLTSGNV